MEGEVGITTSDHAISAGDKYRSFLYDVPESTQWRHGGPPIYHDVNLLFEQGRTKVAIYLTSVCVCVCVDSSLYTS